MQPPPLSRGRRLCLYAVILSAVKDLTHYTLPGPTGTSRLEFLANVPAPQYHLPRRLTSYIGGKNRAANRMPAEPPRHLERRRWFRRRTFRVVDSLHAFR